MGPKGILNQCPNTILHDNLILIKIDERFSLKKKKEKEKKRKINKDIR